MTMLSFVIALGVSMSNADWEVRINAGMFNEYVEEVFHTYKEAKSYLKDNYSKAEQAEMNIDITRSGSTEY